jgi:hypothetical protein
VGKPKQAPCGRPAELCQCGPQWESDESYRSWISHYTFHCEGCDNLYNTHDEFGGAGICPRCSRRGTPPREVYMVAPPGFVLLPVDQLEAWADAVNDYVDAAWPGAARTRAAKAAATEMLQALARLRALGPSS